MSSPGAPGRSPQGTSSDALPVVEGDQGEPVVDVQERLCGVGLGPIADPPGFFGPATRAAVEAFQHRRGLRIDGICGPQTWETLVEASFHLGDRLLYRKIPMMRGDDVAELQQRLSALGFDAGRVDGIFGDQTAMALAEFQRNTGHPPDGIAGPATVADLARLATRQPEPELVTNVRARDELRHIAPTLAGRLVAVGEGGGMQTVVAALRRRLVRAGARVVDLHHPEGSTQAQEANAAGVDLYVGVRLDPAVQGCATAFYSGYRYESPGGRRLAEIIQAHVTADLSVPDRGTRGMSVPVLRETRMPAVIVEVGPARMVVERGPALGDALAAALSDWVSTAGS